MRRINPLFDPPTNKTAQPQPQSTSPAPVATTQAYVGAFGSKRRVPVLFDPRTRSVWPVAKPEGDKK